MNLDFALANRALKNIGLAPLTPEDKAAKNETWLTAAEYYLQAMLEALAKVEWTSAKRRRELAPARMPGKGGGELAFAYELPIDCAKAIELDRREYYEIEGGLLHTDAKPARLLYVSNGRRLTDQTELSAGGAFRKPSRDYICGGDAERGRRREPGDNIVTGGNWLRPAVIEPPPEAGEDFPDYGELSLEPNFYLYWECLLSSKYALRLTDKPELSMVYFNKAMAAGMEAEAVSKEQAAARRVAAPTWQEELGLS